MRTNNKGFSLIELIVVIAIIAVLAVVLAPQYIQYVERGRESNDIQVATNIIDAVQIAIADVENEIPAGYYFEVLWITGEESLSYTDRGMLMVRHGIDSRVSVFNNNDGDDIERLPYSYDLTELNETLIEILGTTDPKAIGGTGATSELVSTLEEGKSQLAQDGNLALHVSTETGEVALAALHGNSDAANKWVEIGLDVTPAP